MEITSSNQLFKVTGILASIYYHQAIHLRVSLSLVNPMPTCGIFNTTTNAFILFCLVYFIFISLEVPYCTNTLNSASLFISLYCLQ